MEYDLKKLKSDAKKDFGSAWTATKGAFPEYSEEFTKELLTPGKPEPHPIHNLAAKIRSSFLRLGFTEVENPLFIDEEDVYKQYGPEGPAILDRCYYLAGLPRPEIGLSEDKIQKIKTIIPDFSDAQKTALKEILREYKLGRIEGDDFLETIEEKLGVSTEQGARIIDSFEELRNLQAVPTKTTLRSHMTAGWFPTLGALVEKKSPPIKLFSIGLRFRREQRVDATHLRAHYGASCAICAPEMEIEAGKKIVEEILKPLGFKDFEFIQKQATSTYYANKSEYEVFAKKPGFDEPIEIGDIGMYSPLALAQYGIKYPVFNVGFGVERILMIKEGFSDVREVFFPQFYGAQELDDNELLESVSIVKKPESETGKKIAEAIVATARKNAAEKSPCEFLAWEGEIESKKAKVFVFEKEENSALLGPAALNEVYVWEGGIYGVPKEAFKEKIKKIQDEGKATGITYIGAMADHLAVGIEEAAKEGRAEYSFQFKMAKSAPDINLEIAEPALKFIQSKKKELMLKGPLFFECRAEFS